MKVRTRGVEWSVHHSPRENQIHLHIGDMLLSIRPGEATEFINAIADQIELLEEAGAQHE